MTLKSKLYEKVANVQLYNTFHYLKPGNEILIISSKNLKSSRDFNLMSAWGPKLWRVCTLASRGQRLVKCRIFFLSYILTLVQKIIKIWKCHFQGAADLAWNGPVNCNLTWKIIIVRLINRSKNNWLFNRQWKLCPALGTAPFNEIFNFQYAREKNDTQVSENEVYPLLHWQYLFLMLLLAFKSTHLALLNTSQFYNPFISPLNSHAICLITACLQTVTTSPF